jgi:hypothetical protein
VPLQGLPVPGVPPWVLSPSALCDGTVNVSVVLSHNKWAMGSETAPPARIVGLTRQRL